MLPRSALMLVAILTLSAGVAFSLDQGQQTQRPPKNLEVIKIEIKPGEPWQPERAKPFIVGDLFSLRVVMTNVSSETVQIKAADVLLQDRPELRKDERLVPYREGASEHLHSTETDVELPKRPGLFPQQSRGIGYVVLNDWYEPLLQGQYRLIVRHRFEPDQNWIESSITFDVLSSDPGLSKTPFASDSLSSIDDDVVRSVIAKKPAWRHERVAPITGSENIIIDYWITGRTRVRSYILELPSPEEATRRLQSQYGEANERLPGLGDEGLVISGNAVAFRKGRLEIQVLASVLRKAEFGEQLKLSKGFARYIADALPAAGLYSKVILPQPPFATASQVEIALAATIDGRLAERSSVAVPKFKTAELAIGFDLLMKNTTAEPVKVVVEFNHMQNRPELNKDGHVISYLEDVQKIVTTNKEPPDYRRLRIVLLRPNERQAVERLSLADWYGPLQPGQYRLRNKHRLSETQDWIDCGSVDFEIIP